MFRWEYHRVTSGSVFYHYHPQYELSLVECTSATRVVGDGVHRFAGSELILIPPNTPHRWKMGSKHHPGGLPKDVHVSTFPAEFRVAIFSTQSVGTDVLQRPELVEVRELLHRARRGLAFNKTTEATVGPIMRSMERLNGTKRLIAFLSILQTLHADATAAPLVSEHYESSGAEAEYRRIADLIDHFTSSDRLGEDTSLPSLREAARFVHMSVPTFTRFFKRMTGHTFVTYFNSFRIAKAGALLTETDLPIVDISHRAGFGNLSHFNRQFLKHTGMQPREYRRRKGEE